MDVSNCTFRVTWRMPKDTQTALKRITDKTSFTQEEVGNMMLRFAVDNFDGFKSALEKYAREKDAKQRKQKAAESTVSKLSPEALEKISLLSPEDIEKLLNS